MQITEVRIELLDDLETPCKAKATIIIDGAFAVHDLRVMQGEDLFVLMPSRRRLSGEYYEVAHPVTAEARKQIQGEVIKAYRREVGEH